MTRHPRSTIVQEAEFKIFEAINDITKEYDLTDAERIRIISTYMSTMAKYMIRFERHPENPDKPGDIE